MRLSELEPEFSRVDERIEPRQVILGDHETWRERGCPTQEVVGPVIYHCNVKTLEEAQQIMFLCPACFTKNGGPENTHSVLVGFHGRDLLPHQSSQSRDKQPSRWNVAGTGTADLTLNPSIDCECWHGWIKNGEISHA